METNEQFKSRIIEWINNRPGNDIHGMHKGTATRLGGYIPTLWSPPTIVLVNPATEFTNIELEFRIDDSVSEIVLLQERVQVSRGENYRFIDENDDILDNELATLEQPYFVFDGGSAILDGQTLMLFPDILIPVVIKYIKNHPWVVFDVPQNNLDLYAIENIEVIVTYDAYDPDLVAHGGIRETHTVRIPPIEQMELWGNEMSTRPIYPGSELAKNAISYYALADKDILKVIDEERYNEILNELQVLDNSTWEKTVIDTTFYDERYISEFIVRKREYDSGEFEDTRIELSL